MVARDSGRRTSTIWKDCCDLSGVCFCFFCFPQLTVYVCQNRFSKYVAQNYFRFYAFSLEWLPRITRRKKKVNDILVVRVECVLIVNNFRKNSYKNFWGTVYMYTHT